MTYGFYEPWMTGRDKNIRDAAAGIYESVCKHYHQIHGKLCNIKPKKSKQNKK